MPQLYDISVPLQAGLPTWPESHGIHISRLMTLEEGGWTISRLDVDVHSGTHIDAPLHIVPGGKTTCDIPLEKLVGPCFVAEFFDCKVITAEDLERASLPRDVKKLLLKTDNSRLWDDPRHPFYEDFCALSADGAQWVVERGIHLVGIDYLSIQRFHDSPQTHVILLENEVVILETLDLRAVPQGTYELWCLPLKVVGVEGIPARAVLRKGNEREA